MSATSLGLVPSAEYLRGEGLVWLIGAVVYLLAATAGPMPVSAGSGWPHFCAAATWLLPINCHFQDYKARCSWSAM